MSNPFSKLEEFSAEDRASVEDYAQKLKKQAIETLKKRRSVALKNARCSESELEEVFSGKCFTAQEALRRGLVDHIGTLEEVLTEKYPNHVMEEKVLYHANQLESPHLSQNLTTSAKYSLALSRIRSAYELADADLTSINIKESLEAAVADLRPDQLTNLIEELLDKLQVSANDRIRRSLA